MPVLFEVGIQDKILMDKMTMDKMMMDKMPSKLQGWRKWRSLLGLCEQNAGIIKSLKILCNIFKVLSIERMYIRFVYGRNQLNTL